MNTNDTLNAIEIQLTQGKIAIIDAKHTDLAKLNWFARLDKTSGNFYAYRNIPNPDWKHRINQHMAKVILERKIGRSLIKGELCDHVDGDTLNNLESNLRVANCSESSCNRGKRKDNKSGYKGVSFQKSTGKYRAEIMANGKSRFLGLFLTKEDAYEVYCTAAKELHGEFARLE